jgi:5-methylcytosine-specific restriction endonuclease McrA
MTRIEKNCIQCQKTFLVQKYREMTAMYCSRACSYADPRFGDKIRASKIGKSVSPHSQFKKGHRQSEESRLKMSVAKKGCIPVNKKPPLFITCAQCGISKQIKHCEASEKCCSKRCADKYKDRGKTTAVVKLRASKMYREWRKAVFDRDDYTCLICGQRGGILNADHIKKFADHPEFRFDVTNGRTLCKDCHLNTPTFGNGRRCTTLF